MGASAVSSDQALSSSVEGAEAQAKVEALSRAASTKEFDAQAARQQPYIDAGTAAIDPYTEAISNRGDVSGLPATTLQSGMISDFLGGNAPGFVTDEAMANLNATELERNKGRLSDLINVGLGGTASSAGSMVNLGSTVGNSLAYSGNTAAQSLQDAATSRQNMANSAITSLSGLPAYYNAQSGGQTSTNPYITAQNPLGLTSGAGL